MQISFQFGANQVSDAKFLIIGAFSKKNGKDTEAVLSGWPTDLKNHFQNLNGSSEFTGAKGSNFSFHSTSGNSVQVVGLGEKKDHTFEGLRRATANVVKRLPSTVETVTVAFDTLVAKSKLEDSAAAFTEAALMTTYNFDNYLSKKNESKLKSIVLETKTKKASGKKADKAVSDATLLAESVNTCRNFINEPPNELNSEKYAKAVEKDAKGIKGVKVKVLDKSALKKEKMGMFLSVNAGSAYGPRLVHLTYTPAKVTKNTKHIALVGKGLTFDTGGYSLKPPTAMVGMKFDMGGSATVYGAFRAAALLQLPVKVSCFLGMTDNCVNSEATVPDSIVKARNGKTVEILNTDAEGRLVLGDVLSYASDQKPNAIIDAATLTGAILIALGGEVCGLFGNDQKLKDGLLKSAERSSEYMWSLPIIDEFRKDMKSSIADLKNIGGSRFGGSSKAAAFLEEFVGEDISWAHLDIAGVASDQGHLPYCPSKGASGLVVRTLVDYLRNV